MPKDKFPLKGYVPSTGGTGYTSANYPYETTKISDKLSDDDYMKEVGKRATSFIESGNRSALKNASNDPFSPPPQAETKRQLKRSSGKSSSKR